MIYGRREEFDKDKNLKQKRGALMNNDQVLMSYDRIKPKFLNNYITCNVKNGKFIAKNLSPIYKIGPYEDDMYNVTNLVEAVDNTEYLTDERKVFLKEKIPYCLEYFKAEKNGVDVQITRNGREFQTDE
ncbi:hypothetical protein BFP75_03850 [Maribacter sp. 4G9]|nr:hypothetical protein BFP75_03850 [Maribacter sp. 4G9]